MKNKKHNRHILLFNTVLWLCSFVILLFLFSSNSTHSPIDYIYTGSFLITIIIPVSINLYVLIPYFLKKEKYVLFTLFFIVNLLLFTQLNVWFFSSFIDVVFPNYYFISYHSNTKLLFIFSAFFTSTLLLKLSENWLYLNQTKNKLLQQKNKLIATQLSTLKAQINPHFLFNSLNVIYSLALKNKEETTDAIVQLSDILRYLIYDANTPKVSLKNELKILKKYIRFQSLRYESFVKVSLHENIDDDTFLLHPMLLLPLVENSYKHGITSTIKNPFINIRISKKEDEFLFLIKNSFDTEKPSEKDKYKGVGIKNIKQNLQLMYPNKHQFSITKNNNIFTVSLKIINEN